MQTMNEQTKYLIELHESKHYSNIYIIGYCLTQDMWSEPGNPLTSNLCLNKTMEYLS